MAKRNSKVTAQQFQRFCNQIGAPIKRAEKDVKDLFSSALIQEVFEVQEYVFDAKRLREWINSSINRSNLNAHRSTEVTKVDYIENGIINVISRNSNGNVSQESYSSVFNCTYSGISQIDKDSNMTQIKHELCELALINPPSEMANLGITIMDGPFFSCMPFPSMDCHSLWHVRYSPHKYWLDNEDCSPYQILKRTDIETRVDRMIRDGSRYIPSLKSVGYLGSIYETKTVLQKNENDDGRPILFRESKSVPGMYSILGGKIDNIYDILSCIDERLTPLDHDKNYEYALVGYTGFVGSCLKNSLL